MVDSLPFALIKNIMLQMVPLFYHKTDFVSLYRQMVDGLPIVIYTEIILGSPLDNDRYKSTICHVVYCFQPFANLTSTICQTIDH